MKKNDYYKFLTISFSLLIPAPGRLAYGIVLIILFNLLMLLGTLFRRLIKILKLEDFHAVLIALALISVSILFKQFLIMINPTMALVLGFNIYLPAVCSFMIGYLYKEAQKDIASDLVFNMKRSGIFSIFAFVFFLIRDMFGYGTITFPGANIIHTARVFGKNGGFIVGNFFASIPGSLVLAALLFVGISIAWNRIESVISEKGEEGAAE